MYAPSRMSTPAISPHSAAPSLFITLLLPSLDTGPCPFQGIGQEIELILITLKLLLELANPHLELSPLKRTHGVLIAGASLAFCDGCAGIAYTGHSFALLRPVCHKSYLERHIMKDGKGTYYRCCDPNYVSPTALCYVHKITFTHFGFKSYR